MGMPLLRGRDFSEQDGKDSRPVVIINSTLARRYFGDEDPVGKRIFVGFNSQAPREIVGVLADERNNNLKDDPRPNVYVPYFQTVWSNSMYLVVRSGVTPSSLSPALRGQIRAVAPGSPIYDEKTMEQVFSDALAQPRFSAVILIVFSATALLLASAGIYAFVSFLTAQRVQEFAIRMALGAQASDILKLVLSRGLLLATMGVAAGTAAALILTRLISSLLFGISPTDPITFAGIAAIVMAVVMAACYFPARRATKVDPMVALRSE
jgi:predicted permease